MRKLIVVVDSSGGKPPSLHAYMHTIIIIVVYAILFSVCMAVNMFVHSLDNAPSTSSWLMNSVICEHNNYNKIMVQVISFEVLNFVLLYEGVYNKQEKCYFKDGQESIKAAACLY